MCAWWYRRLLRMVVAVVAVVAGALVVPSSGLAVTGWSGLTTIDDLHPPQYISCPSTSFCVAVGANGYAQTFNGSSWGTPVFIDPSAGGSPLISVSCPFASFCAAIDFAGNALTFSGTTWSAPEPIETTGNTLSALSCASSSFCVAGDVGGNAFVYNGSLWSGPVEVNDLSNEEDIGGISCPSSTFCVAAGENGTIETSTNGGATWSTPLNIASGVNLQSVSCPSTAFCVAVDNAGNAYTYNGSSWIATPIDTANGGGSLTSVSCPSASFCVAIDASENVFMFNGSSWSAPQSLESGADLHPGVSCASASFCVAVDGGGNAFIYGAVSAAPPPPALPPPILGKTVNASPVSGVVFVKAPPGTSLDEFDDVPAAAAAGRGFVRLTGAQQIPIGSEINSLDGSLSLITATGQKRKTQSGTFRGAIFKLSQTTASASKGLVTLSLMESAFKGAPTYASCNNKRKVGHASAAAVNRRVLQLLRASAHGKFRTRGRYSAATVLGTIWTVADRCDGTLTHDITDSVSVTDFVRRKTIVLHAGQSYLAKAPPRRT